MFIRENYKMLIRRFESPRKFIQVIAGPRQVGKTTLVLQCLDELGEISHYASADAAKETDSAWVDQQWEAARVKCGRKKGILVLDEIQKIGNWSEQVKKNWDGDTRKKIPLKVVLLGSSRLLIQQGLTESLAGRFEVIPITHWSYVEMHAAFRFTPEQFVWFGGYPGAAPLIKDPKRWKDYILHSLIETTISKDILMLTRVDKPALLRQLFTLGCAYSGQIFSFNKMLGQLTDAGNTTTLSAYLQLLDSAGLLAGIEKYSGKLIRTKSSSPKLQVKDTSLLSVFSGNTFVEVRKQPDTWGRHVESAVGAHLLNSSVKGEYEVFYWREGNDEVDFIVRKNKKIIAIEVKSGVTRRLSGMKAFTNRYKADKILLIGDSGIHWKDFLNLNPGDIF